jgi:hypothetical protein
MSGTQVSSAPNVLFDPMMALRQQEGQNQLLQQQQDIGGHEIEMGARLAGTLLDQTQYPTTEARAAAYPTLLAQARQLAPGYFKNAPATYPGDDATHALAQLGTPSQTLSERQANIAANQAIANAGNTPPAPAGGGAPAAPAAPGATIGQRQNNPGNLTFAGQPYASPGQGNRFASFPDMATGVAANADQLSLYQTQHGINTVRGAVTRWVGDPKADLTSYIGDIAKSLGVGPDDKIDLTDPAVQAKFIQAQFPHESAGGGYVLNPADVAKGVQMAAARRGQQVQPAPTAAVAAVPGAPAAPGAPATPAPYRVAGAMQPPPGTAAAPGQAAPDLNGPRPLPPGGPGAPVVTPQQLANTPTNQVMPGAPNGPPAVAPPSAPAQAAPAGGPAPPQMQPLLPNGLTARQQAILDAQGRTGQMTGQQRLAAEQAYQNQNIQLAQKQFSDWVQLQTLAVSQGQLSNSQMETNLKLWQAQHPELAPNAREATIAYRALQDIAPKIRAGTATQDEIDRYNNAAIAYQDFKTVTDPISKAIVQVPSRPLPDGFPPPSGAAAGGGAARPLTQGLSPSQQEVERDPAAYKVAETRYVADAEDARQLGPAGRKAQADQVRIKEMEDVLQRFSTGQGTEARTAAAAFLQRWLPSAITGWEKESPSLSGAEAAQAFGKLALVGAGSQEQSVLGPRGGYQAIKLFKDANPGINLQDATNKSILDMQLISNQANYDYSQAALSHFTENENKFKTTHQYDSLNQFDRTWNDQRNPEVYAAAMGAISGQQPEKWAKGLSDAEYDRALQIVSRAKPDAVVNTKSGRYSMQPTAVTSGTQAKPGDTVIRFDHSGNRLP